MSDFLINLVGRSLDPNPAVRPRLASRYEPLPLADKMMPGVLVDPADPGHEEAGDDLVFRPSSLPLPARPVPALPPATIARPSRLTSSAQSNEPRDSQRPEDIFFATESAPDKLRPRAHETPPPGEIVSATDSSVPQRLLSDPLAPARMIPSPDEENPAVLDLAQSPSSKSNYIEPGANAEYEIDKDLRLVLESLADRTTVESRDATGMTQPPVHRSQIAAAPLSVNEEASRSANERFVYSVAIQKIVSAGESPERIVEVEDEPAADKSVQVTAFAEETGPSAPSPAVAPVIIERIVPANDSTRRFVAAAEPSLTTSPVQETAAPEEGRLNLSSPAVPPMTIEKIIATESSARFSKTDDPSRPNASVRGTAAAREAGLPAPNSPVHSGTVERIVPAGEASRAHFVSAKDTPVVSDVSPARPTEPAPKPTTIVVHPEISQVRAAAEMRVDSPAPEPNVQVTIGRIEVRAIKAAEVQPKNNRTAQPTLMSLDDYLRQRAQGGKR